nr:MAG TPA: hypothetical protein [Caudoviricetes sp.]
MFYCCYSCLFRWVFHLQLLYHTIAENASVYFNFLLKYFFSFLRMV